MKRVLINICSRICDTCVRKTEKRKALPKLVYNLLSDKELRKKLNEIGLPTHGHRKVLSVVDTGHSAY